jgi:hypothetical protein
VGLFISTSNHIIFVLNRVGLLSQLVLKKSYSLTGEY